SLVPEPEPEPEPGRIRGHLRVRVRVRVRVRNQRTSRTRWTVLGWVLAFRGGLGGGLGGRDQLRILAHRIELHGALKRWHTVLGADLLQDHAGLQANAAMWVGQAATHESLADRAHGH